MARLVAPAVCVVALLGAPFASGGAGADASRAADDRSDRARRRTPVVEVFERTRDAVVSITSTEEVLVRNRSPFDSMFDDLFARPGRPRTQTRKRSSMAVRGDAQNIGFAIPVDQLRSVLPELLDVERMYRIDSGLAVDTLSDPPRVTDVRPDGPAAVAGIRAGDEIVAIDGRPARKGADLDFALIRRRPTDAVRLELRRDGRPIDAELRLAERPAPDGEALARDRLGLELFPIPIELTEELGRRGLMVTAVEPGGPADRAGVERRDVLVSLGRRYVTTVDELGRLLEEAPSGLDVALRVLRVEAGRKLQLHGPIRLR